MEISTSFALWEAACSSNAVSYGFGFLPRLQLEWRDDRKGLMIRAQEAFAYVPDNHCHIWADKPCEKGKGRVDGFLDAPSAGFDLGDDETDPWFFCLERLSRHQLRRSQPPVRKT